MHCWLNRHSTKSDYSQYLSFPIEKTSISQETILCDTGSQVDDSPYDNYLHFLLAPLIFLSHKGAQLYYQYIPPHTDIHVLL